MEALSAYIPRDRCQAIARNESLPDRSTGAALFADISGFTPLTEALLKAYGPKRGAEELTQQLNLIYDALVLEVHHYGGSVIAFSGDAITCWFDGDDGLQATACGLAMQQTMSRFANVKTPSGEMLLLAMKVAVATGPIRRFQLGDPQIQYIDALAGATLDHMAAVEHHAGKGEVVVGAEVLAQIGDKLEVVARRDDQETGRPCGVVARLLDPYDTQVELTRQPVLALETLTEAQACPWLLPPVYERLRAGAGEFLTELRPAVALFLSFRGIDYDQDEAAGTKLETYIRWVQNILVRYEAYLFQLTIGDKGSYLYTAFGAPIAHEDDAVRAVSAALELRTPPPELNFIDQIKIGLSQGQMRTGAYGGTMRRTYGVLGDAVNLAARLMQAAAPGQILVSKPVRQTAGESFIWGSMPAFKVKGKAEPVTAFAVTGLSAQRVIQLQEPNYALPMVGREAELTLIEQKMTQVLAGHGQIVGIVAEAGMGKSRLVAEVIRLATGRQLMGYGGECQSYGTNIGYLVWQPIWAGIFGLDPDRELSDQISALAIQLGGIDPALAPRLPLLGAVLNLSIPDNDLTRSFDAKLRKTSLESLLVDCLRARAKETPLLLVLEDLHWLDPLSHDLLEVMGRAIVDLPVLLVLAYRPPQLERLQAPRVEQLPYFTQIPLADFTPQEAERLIGLKLEQFFGVEAQASPTLIERITARAQGNPFYIEELLNYLQDQGFDPQDSDSLEQLQLPTSLHSLILSRIDQLTERQKSAIKVASVIGRLFRAVWLWGIYPELGDPENVKIDLETISRMDLAPMDKPEPELTYIFRHIVTQEVAYESLSYATRAMLHDRIGQFIEQNYAGKLDRFIDLLAFHYDHSENTAKKKEYLRKAGEVAQEEYNNEAAIDYYQRVLPLLLLEEQVPVLLKLGRVLQLKGRWDEAQDKFKQALALAKQLGNRSAQAWCETDMGKLLWQKGLFAEALAWLDRARIFFEKTNDQAGVGEIWHYQGTIAAQQGNLAEARRLWEQSLAIRQELDDKVNIANLLSNLAIAARNRGDHQESQRLNEQALELRYKLGDKRAIALSLNNLGQLLTDMGKYEIARPQLEVAVDLQRQIGDRFQLANALHTLANVLRDAGDYGAARQKYDESLGVLWELGERWMLAYVLEDMGGLAALRGYPARALRLVGAAAVLREETGSSLSPAEQDMLEKMLGPARQALGQAAEALEAEGRALSLAQAVEYARKPST
ncbi:MAG: tetratricopeptide repeat protein [Chloroflexota bacterium]